jgi:dTDP-4-dehydrorhamnose 3,5-epimerase
MRFERVRLEGACLIYDDSSPDERGMFNRVFSAGEFETNGIPGSFVQMGLSRTLKRGTLRGMHFQHAPRAEGKLVRCMHGRAFDAIIDLRRESETFKQTFTVELSAEANVALFIPPGFAHGFLTLTDDVEMFYSMTEIYVAELADGVRWNDPAFGIVWPEPVLLVSQRDRSFKDFV